MEVISVEYFPISIYPGNNEENMEYIHIEVMTMKNMHVIYMLICFIYLKYF